MNATRFSERLRTDQLNQADPEQTILKRSVGLVAAIPVPQSDRVVPGLHDMASLEKISLAYWRTHSGTAAAPGCVVPRKTYD